MKISNRNTPLQDRYRVIEDVTWGFDGVARMGYKGWNSSRTVNMDPCEAYGPQDSTDVFREIELVEHKLKLPYMPFWHLFSKEALTRTNGEAFSNSIYDHGKDSGHIECHIGLFAKRIPIHPAMMRYLIAHEYGHVVWYNSCLRRGVRAGWQEEEELFREYAALRGIPYIDDRSYGPGTWHKSVSEVIANDVRVLLFNCELEFWPHWQVCDSLRTKDGQEYMLYHDAIRWWRDEIEALNEWDPFRKVEATNAA